MRDRNRVSERERVGENGREWESKIVRVRKPLRTAKEPALVFQLWRKPQPQHSSPLRCKARNETSDTNVSE